MAVVGRSAIALNELLDSKQEESSIASNQQ